MKKYLVLLIALVLIITGCGKKEEPKKKQNNKKEEVVEKKVEIVDLESDSRPYAVVINNYPDATKVQAGLNDAYIVYEIPIEGGMTRSVALFKDKEDVKLGTIRSARQNHLDYVMENDAIYTHFGWSPRATAEISTFGINNINGVVSPDSSIYWREEKFKGDWHSAYTSIERIEKMINSL